MTCLELTLIIVCISFVLLIASIFSVPKFLTFVYFRLALDVTSYWFLSSTQFLILVFTSW